MANVVYYSIPKNAYIFNEMILSLENPNMKKSGPTFKNSVQCIFTKYDAMFLEKIIGSQKSEEFLEKHNISTTFII